MDIKYDNLKDKLDNIKSKYPKLSQIWLSYLKKHTILYEKVLNEVNTFINNVDETNVNLNEMNIIMLYLIMNNDMNNDINN